MIVSSGTCSLPFVPGYLLCPSAAEFAGGRPLVGSLNGAGQLPAIKEPKQPLFTCNQRPYNWFAASVWQTGWFSHAGNLNTE